MAREPFSESKQSKGRYETQVIQRRTIVSESGVFSGLTVLKGGSGATDSVRLNRRVNRPQGHRVIGV
jgi:hypothetical protein